MGFKWNPLTGELNLVSESTGSSGGVADEALSAKVLKVSLIANETVSALKLIYQSSSDYGGLADHRDVSKKDAIGISLTSATVGNQFDVLLFGRVDDLFFNYPVNEQLFLGENGNITSIAPNVGHSVLIGKGLGSGAIFISIERPIEL